jgi:hypothetical protein
MPLLLSPVYSPTACCNCSPFLFRVLVGRCSSPTLLWSVPHFSCCYKPSPFQAHWGRCAIPAFSSQLVYLQFCEGVPLPHSAMLRVPPPQFATVFFFSFSAACLLFRLFFSLFSLGGGQSVQGAMLIWPRVVCGSTMCCLAHLVVCFSQAG